MRGKKQKVPRVHEALTSKHLDPVPRIYIFMETFLFLKFFVTPTVSLSALYETQSFISKISKFSGQRFGSGHGYSFSRMGHVRCHSLFLCNLVGNGSQDLGPLQGESLKVQTKIDFLFFFFFYS